MGIVGRGWKIRGKKGEIIGKICTNLKELGVICENHETLFPGIVVRSKNSWKSGGKFPEKWSWGRGTTNRDGRAC